jgi:hypothetical protein
MKKKSLLIFCFVLCCITASATDVFLYDFETPGSGPSSITIAGYIQDGTLNIIDNPLQTGINSSNKCLTFESQSGIPDWGGIDLSIQSTTSTETTRYLYMQVSSNVTESSTPDHAFRIGLKNGDSWLDKVSLAMPNDTVTTAWRELCFKIDAGVNFNGFRIMPWVAGIFKIDNIRLSDVAPNLPEIKHCSINFETESQNTGWVNSDRTSTSVAPFSTAVEPNTSSYFMKAWVGNGEGQKYMVQGVTTEESRYLHVNYYFKSTEDHPDQYQLPLQVKTKWNGAVLKSSALDRNSWHNVTIDLGVGTPIYFLSFSIDDWWIDLGIDDVVIDGSPTHIITGIVPKTVSSVSFATLNSSLFVNNVTGKTNISIYSIAGNLVKQAEVNKSTSFKLNKGLYIIKVVDANESFAKNILIY